MLFVVLAIVIFLSAIFSFTIAISARKVDFGDFIFDRRVIGAIKRKERDKKPKDGFKLRNRKRTRQEADSIVRIRQEILALENKAGEIQNKIQEYREKAKMLVQQGKKEEAKEALKMSQYYLKELNSVMSRIQKLSAISDNIQRAMETPALISKDVSPSEVVEAIIEEASVFDDQRFDISQDIEDILLEEETEILDSELEEIEKELKELKTEEAEEIEKIQQDTYKRDLIVRLPKNMCLNEVFRLEIKILKTEKYEKELNIKEVPLDTDEAKRYSITVSQLGKTLTEATAQIDNLKEGPLIIRPITIGHLVRVAPSSRAIYFDPETEEFEVDFYITPVRWTKEVKNVLKIEFEQNYKIIKTIDFPIRIYKHKLEAIFGLNISKWQQYALFIYSAIGTIAGFISAFQSKFVPWIQQLFS